MHKGILASRRQLAIEEIEAKTGIDVSKTAIQKAPDVEHLQLFQLEKLAREIQGGDQAVVILEKIKNVSGVGPALMEKIIEALEE